MAADIEDILVLLIVSTLVISFALGWIAGNQQ